MYLEQSVEGMHYTRHESDSLDRASGRFALEYLSQHPERAADSKITGIFKDLNNGIFWSVLYALDGPANGDLSDLAHGPDFRVHDYEADRKKAREWTTENFSKYELNQLIDLTVELALDPPSIEGKPGYVRGHSILLRHVVDKPGSIFSDRITKAGEKRLVNGAFWEEMGDGNPRTEYLHDLLMDHSTDLDPAFAKRGLEIYERNKKRRPNHQVDLQDFTDEALDNYLKFVRKLSGSYNPKAISPEATDELIMPYIDAVLGPHYDDPQLLRFGPIYDTDKDEVIIPEVDFRQRLSDPLVQQSLKRSQANRTSVIERLSYILTTNDYSGDLALDVIDAIGGQTGDKILAKVIRMSNSGYGSQKAASAIARSDSPLKNRANELFFGEHAEPVKV